MGAVWCAPCNSLASWFAWSEDEITTKRFWKKEYELIYDLVKNKDIYFITIHLLAIFIKLYFKYLIIYIIN